MKPIVVQKLGLDPVSTADAKLPVGGSFFTPLLVRNPLFEDELNQNTNLPVHRRSYFVCGNGIPIQFFYHDQWIGFNSFILLKAHLLDIQSK